MWISLSIYDDLGLTEVFEIWNVISESQSWICGYLDMYIQAHTDYNQGIIVSIFPALSWTLVYACWTGRAPE